MKRKPRKDEDEDVEDEVAAGCACASSASKRGVGWIGLVIVALCGVRRSVRVRVRFCA